jgi:hypothetical protein
MWTYYQFSQYLGNKDDRPVPKVFGSPRSTRVERIDDHTIVIRYHWTNVITLHSDDTFTLNTNGWQTVTSKKRINTFSPIYVYSQDHVWYFGNGEKFYDGMCVTIRGTVIPPKATTTQPTTPSSIPDAPYYVLSNDSFMSGWGCANGKINTIILTCADMTEAQDVAAYAQSRGDQKYVRIVNNKPKLRLKTHFYSLHDRYDYGRWYGR